jgi:hypothetical protein
MVSAYIKTLPMSFAEHLWGGSSQYEANNEM